MAKKKQFAGKKTKLAKLPLTQALASREGGSTSATPVSPPAYTLGKLPLTWDEVPPAGGEPLLATFLFLIRELADLTSQLQSSPDLAVMTNHRIYLPPRVPGYTHLVQALREARKSLKDLRNLLSLPQSGKV
jgi:hypothetical protein